MKRVVFVTRNSFDVLPASCIEGPSRKYPNQRVASGMKQNQDPCRDDFPREKRHSLSLERDNELCCSQYTSVQVDKQHLAAHGTRLRSYQGNSRRACGETNNSPRQEEVGLRMFTALQKAVGRRFHVDSISPTSRNIVHYDYPLLVDGGSG